MGRAVALLVIDLHAHVLPGLDDGPGDEEGALALLRRAAEAGTRTIAATPHLRDDFPAVRVDAIASACTALQARVPGEWRVRIVSGAELDLTWALAATTAQLRRASFRGRGTDLLVETPYGDLSDGFEVGLRELRSRGYRLLLAHPERNRSLQRRPERLEALAGDGVLVQLTASSLLRDPERSGSAALAHRLVRSHVATVLASDAHSAGDWRPPGLQAAVAVARALAPRRADWMVTVAPAAILAGTPLPAPPGV